MDVGARVTVLSIPNSRGTIRFAGETSFSAGRWLGVELDAGGGKNDGSVAGQRYFSCDPNHGVFAKPSGVRLLLASAGGGGGDGATLRARAPPAGVTSSARPSVGSRTSTAISRTSAASPSPRPPSSVSRVSSVPSSRPPSTTPGARPGSRAGTEASRRSSLVPSVGIRSPGVRTPGVFSPDLGAPSDSPESPSPAVQTPASPDLMPPPPVPSSTAAVTSQVNDPFSLSTKRESTVSTAREGREATIPVREHDETLARLRILERSRTEDRERLRDLERMREEERNWKDVKARLQAKLVENQQELKSLRLQLKDTAIERDAANTRYADLADEVEMATLDKEVAEEKVDALEAVVGGLKERIAELEIETSVLKAPEGSTEGDAGQEGRLASLQLLQTQKQNDRLKDALAKMRDMMAETESASRKRTVELEKELDLATEMQASFDEVAARAETAETQIEDLKQQLDAALSSEEMLEQLTERNLSLTEKVEAQNAVIEDLEAYKEVAEELEENHVEAEKELQEEIDAKESLLRDQKRRGDELAETVFDYEQTLGQFRELVGSLQSDLENMRQQHDVQQAESQNLTSQSQAMLTLNLKLQQTVSKSQVKTIDLELRRLDAAQASKRLVIIRPYLPSTFETDSEAVDALLFFERLAAKVDLISNSLAQKYNVAEGLNTVVSELLVTVCETRGRLARLATLMKRFAATLHRCTSETFVAMGGLYRELSGIEKRIDYFVAALQSDELKEAECGNEVEKFIAQVSHLAEVHLDGLELDLGERQQGCANQLNLDLDTVIAGFGFAKQTLALLSKDTSIPLEPQEADLAQLLFDPLQLLIDQSRTAQSLLRKLEQRLGDLVRQSASIVPSVAEPIVEVSKSIRRLASVSSKVADLMGRYANDIRISHSALSVTTLQGLIDEAAIDLNVRTANVLVALDTELALAISRLTGLGPPIADPEQVVTTSYSPPWVGRVSQIAANMAQNVEAEERATKYLEELKELRREMHTREQAMQENSVKLEVLDRRMEAVKKQADHSADLESELARIRKQEIAYEETISALQRDLEASAAELLKVQSGSAEALKRAKTLEATESVAFTGSLETSHLIAQIEALRGAVRFVRQENSFLRSQPLALPALPTATLAPPSDAVREVREQHRSLLQDTLKLASTPTMVDLCTAGRPLTWTSAAGRPERQVEARRDAVRRLNRRLEQLKGKMVEMPRMTSVRA